jgi:hypothetical protein
VVLVPCVIQDLNPEKLNSLKPNYNIMQTIIRPDYVFSYWIFVWFILYFMRIVSINPKLWLIFGLIIEVISIFFMLHYKFYYIIRFIIINIFIKTIPVYLVWNTKIHGIDIFYSGLLFVIYLLWLYINNQSLYTIYDMIYKSHVKNPKYIGIGAYLYDKIYHFLQ